MSPGRERVYGRFMWLAGIPIDNVSATLLQERVWRQREGLG